MLPRKQRYYAVFMSSHTGLLQKAQTLVLSSLSNPYRLEMQCDINSDIWLVCSRFHREDNCRDKQQSLHI